MADASGGGIDLGIPGVGPAELVGRGGFGLVYRATQLSSGGVVAIKVLQGNLDTTASIRFEREASALGSLRGHPNICTVYDAGVDPTGRPYLVMELAPSSLAQRIASDGPLPWQDAVTLGVRLAGALETAHRARLLHRDVKPENVLLTAFGEWRLADFGLARLTDDTLSRDVTATVTHAAPELLEGAPASVASDVYALGSTLFVALTGSPAFTLADGAHQASVFRRIAEEPVPDMPGTPADVAEVVRTAMAKDPTERFASAADMGTALQAAQQRAGVVVTPLPLPLGETLPPGLPGPDTHLTEDVRTPIEVGELTTAVEREGREVPPIEVDTSPEPKEGGGWRPSRRALLTAVALVAVAAVVGGALALAGGDGDGGAAASSDEISVAGDWEAAELVVEECAGAEGGPCPDTDAFDFSFSIDCPPVPTSGGFGRSVAQTAEDSCTISLIGLDPVALEFEGRFASGEVSTESPPGGIEMEFGAACHGALTNFAFEFSVSDAEVRGDEQVAAELEGDLYVYPLYSDDPSCGSHYQFSYVMEEAS
jgi:hypothetical protein